MKSKVRVCKVLSLLLATIVVIGTVIMETGVSYAANGEVSIDLSKEYQQIRGFGGVNIPEWVGSDLSDSQRQTVFGNGEGELGFDVLRIFVNEDSKQWSKAVPTAKAACDKGAIVFASPWNPPSDMVETFSMKKYDGSTIQGKRLKHDKYAAYAEHLNNFVKFMADNGVKLYAISVQNEPDYAYDWTWWTEDECLDFMKNYAGSINCKVISPESFQYKKNMYDKILNNDKALANMDILGTHFYGTQYNDFAYPLFQQKGTGKELWMTEVYYPNSDKDSNENWDQALSLSQHISNSLTDANMQAYVWWYIRRCYGPLNENGSISKRGYVMAQFSKYIRNNYTRVEATKNPVNGVYVSAYKGEGNKVSIVAINTNSNEFQSSCSINGSTIKGAECVRTSGNESLAKVNGTQFSGEKVSIKLPAKSVTTYVLTMNSQVSDDASNVDSSTDSNTDNNTDNNNADSEDSNVIDENSSDNQNDSEIDNEPATADRSCVELAIVVFVVVSSVGVIWYIRQQKKTNIV